MHLKAHWLDEYSEAESLDILRELARRYLDKHGEDLPQAVRTNFLLWLHHGDYDKIVSFEVPYHVCTLAEARTIRQVQAFFSKAEYLPLGIDKGEAALRTFDKAEADCRETNLLFRAVNAGRASLRPRIAGIIYRATQLIAQKLGDVPELSELNLRFGPGATSLSRKSEASLKHKLDVGISCSEDLEPWIIPLLSQMPNLLLEHTVWNGCDEEDWRGLIKVLIHPGKLSFVLKNAKTFRSVETQPVLNGMLQNAIGDLMSNRIRIPGLDTKDQALNQQLAGIGSLTGDLATLDLSSASDTIAFELVATLLPIDWFLFLKRSRVGRVIVPGRRGVTRLEKFSAMGNGYTFPLEALIFWALTYAAQESAYGRRDGFITAAYGDDIICQTAAVDLVKEVLTVCGFTVNGKKSFVDGPFRESCGADYFQGIDIRPVYVKELLSPAVLCSLHNELYRRGEFSACRWIRTLVHPQLMLEGPDGYGDGHFLSASWERRPHNRHLGWSGFTFKAWKQVSIRDVVARKKGDRLLPTYSIYRRGSEPLFDVEKDLLDAIEKASGDWLPGIRTPGKTMNWAYVKYWYRGHGPVTVPSLKMPGAEGTKYPTFPGVAGCKKVTIYTLG